MRFLSPRMLSTSGFKNRRGGRHIEIPFLALILTFRRHRHMTLHWPIKFYPKCTIGDRTVTSYYFSRWWPHRRKSTSDFGLDDVTYLKMSKTIRAHQTLMRCLIYYYFRFPQTSIATLKFAITLATIANTTRGVGYSIQLVKETDQVIHLADW